VKPLKLALQFMEIFFSGEQMDRLRPLLADDFSFSGPLYQFDSTDAYINSLETDPPKGFEYEMIRSFEDESSACIIYQFTKPGVSTPMAQIFEVRKGKISKILLVFDTDAFA
jgi:hypothetical protein